MNINNVKNSDCCGCTACKSICPQNAIQMKYDSQGFLYPIIDNNKCINCGLCIEVCNSKKSINNEDDIKVYAVKHKSSEVLINSSSGGISSALCEACIKKGGVVYGVKYDNDFNVITQRAENLKETITFRGSKYVQSDLRKTFLEVLSDLKQGKNALYFGTSCHIAGLLSFLNKKKISTDNLITVDLICHGVPSPVLFKEYISFISKNKSVERFDFRTKCLGWGLGSKSFGPRIIYKDGTSEINTLKTNAFLSIFFSNTCLRPYCYSCPYTSIEKAADITIADYWGIQQIHPTFFDKNGVSAVIVHTNKGKNFFDLLDNIEYIDSTIENVSKKQANLDCPSKKSCKYEEFWQDYNKKGFKYIMKKYGYYSFKTKIKRKIKNFFK